MKWNKSNRSNSTKAPTTVAPELCLHYPQIPLIITMNNWNASPVLQTNEVAGKYTPKDDDRPPEQRQPEPKNQFLAGDLQKIRRSNHTSEQHHRQDAMDDDEHDEIIKGLLYPGLEDSTTSCEFFDDDYELAQSAVVRTSLSAAAPLRGDSSYSGFSDNHAVHRRSTFDALLASFNDGNDDSYEASYFAAMGRPYADASNQKLGR